MLHKRPQNLPECREQRLSEQHTQEGRDPGPQSTQLWSKGRCRRAEGPPKETPAGKQKTLPWAGLNLPKVMCLSPNPRKHRMWLYVETGP